MKPAAAFTTVLAVGMLALTGCSSDPTPTETPGTTTGATTIATPAKTPTSTPTRAATSEPTPQPAEAAPAPNTLDTASGVAWYTDQENPALLAQYGLVSDVYYPRTDDRNTMCAQTQPTVCTTPEDRLAFMDASIAQFQDDYAAENPDSGQFTSDVAGPGEGTVPDLTPEEVAAMTPEEALALSYEN